MLKFGRQLLRSSALRATRSYVTAPAPMLRRRRWPYLVAIGAAAYGGWRWYTWHNYPEPVAALLRKGLLQQRLRNPDHQKALKYYIEALQKADELGLSHLSDEYTGIQLKIAEVLEHLGMPREAAFIYMEIMGMYLIALTGKGANAVSRDHLIKRDLMVTLMMTMVMKDPVMSRKMALRHMDIAMARVSENATPSLPVGLNQSLLLDFHDGRIPNIAAKVNSDNEKAWGEFRDEAFAIREFMTVASMELGDFWQAALLKYHTTLLMLSSGFDLGECLLSLTNVGALACLQALNYETIAKGVCDPDVPNEEGILPKTNPIKGDMPSGYISTSSLDMVKENTDLQTLFLKTSDRFYSNVRSAIDGLDSSQRRSTQVDEACVMAAFGQGVVALKLGDLKRSSELLNEARIRARGCGLDDVLEHASGEIDKLNLIVKSDRPLSDFSPAELPDINVAFWKIETPQLANAHLYEENS